MHNAKIHSARDYVATYLQNNTYVNHVECRYALYAGYGLNDPARRRQKIKTGTPVRTMQRPGQV